MKILIHGLNFAPELIGVGKYTGEMAEWLAARGHEVRVVTSYPYYPAWRIEGPDRGRWWRSARARRLHVVRCPLWVPRRPGGLARILHLESFAASSAPIVMAQALWWRPELVFGVAPTLLAAPATLAAARLSGALAWLHVQDFEVEAAFATGLVAGARLARAALALEGQILRRFDRVSAISPAMAAHAVEKGVAPAKVALMPNWVATDEVRPLPEGSPLRPELGIARDAVVALYAGNMSEKQGLETLVATARACERDANLHFVFAGEGAARARLQALAAGLANVRFLPLQPPDRLNDLLNLADIHLLPQKAGVATLVMPSKLLGMTASARPVVAGAAPGSALGQVAALCGIVVAPEDGAAMAAAVRELAGDPQRRARLGAAGRDHAVTNWSRDAVLGQFVADLAFLRAARGRDLPAAAELAGSADRGRT